MGPSAPVLQLLPGLENHIDPSKKAETVPTAAPSKRLLASAANLCGAVLQSCGACIRNTRTKCCNFSSCARLISQRLPDSEAKLQS